MSIFVKKLTYCLLKSLQDRPELGNIVNKVKDLINAFNEDKNKAAATIDEGSSLRFSETAPVQSSHNAPCTSKASYSAKDTNSTPSKSLSDKSEDCSELDLAAEGELQKYLAKSLAESASRRSRGRPRTKNVADHTEDDQKQARQIEEKDSSVFEITNKDNKDEQDLLRYLEEGSCGAVLDDDCRPNEGSEKDQQGINMSLYLDKENELNTQVSENTFELNSNDKALMTRTEAESRPPLSPLKSNTKSKSISTNVECVYYPDNEDSVESKATNCCVTPVGRETLQFSAQAGKLMSPDSDSASISSTQQLMKPKPVVSRTYSKVMKSTFQADGGVKNWKKTLPSPHTSANIVSESRLEGLTTKEKIALKKKGNKAANASGNSHVPCSAVDTENENGTKLHPSLCTLDAPKKTRGRSIFKSRTEKCLDGIEKDSQNMDIINEGGKVEKEDPYEFQGSQTPKKKVEALKRSAPIKRGSKRASKLQMIKVKQSQSQARKGVDTGPSLAALPKQESVSSSNNNQKECSSVIENIEHFSKYKREYDVLNNAVELNCNDAEDVSNAVIEIGSRVEINESEAKSTLSENRVCLTKPHNTNRRVYFADECNNDGMKNDHQLQLDKPRKSGLLETGTSGLNADLTDSNTLSRERETNKKETIMPVKRLCESSYSEPHVQKSDALSIKVLQKHTELTDSMKSLKVDKGGDKKRNKISNVVEETPMQSEDPEYKHLGSIYEDDQITMKAPKAKRSVGKKRGDKTSETPYSVDKRTLSRRLRNATSSANNDLLKQQSEAELAKMAHKINEAEDYDFAFCTQEAHMKMQEEQDQQEEYGEAFGFNALVAEQSENLHGKQAVDKQTEQVSTEIAFEPHLNQTQASENANALGKEGRVEKDFSNNNTRDPESINIQTDNLRKADGTGENEKTKEDLSKLETRVGQNVQGSASCFSALKVTGSSVLLSKDLITPGREVALPTEMSRPGYFPIKSNSTRFPRPNLSLMVEFFPSVSSLASTPQLESAATTEDVVLETPGMGLPIKKIMQFKGKSETKPVENLAPKKSLTSICGSENVLETQVTDLPDSEMNETTLQPSFSSELEDSKMDCVEEEIIDKASKSTGREHQLNVKQVSHTVVDTNVEEALIRTVAAEDKVQRLSHLRQKPKNDKAVVHEQVQEVNDAKKVGNENMSESPADTQSQNVESEEASRRDVLATDTCLDYDMDGQDVGNKSQATVPDSVQVPEDGQFKMDQPEKDTEVVLIKEIQGTEETCIPPSTANGFAEKKTSPSLMRDEGNCGLTSSLELPTNPKAATDSERSFDLTGSVSSQHVAMVPQIHATEKFEENTNSNLCLLSESILGASKNPGKSSNASIISSSSTGIILPSAQEGTTHTVGQNLETSENHVSNFVTGKKDAEEMKPNSTSCNQLKKNEIPSHIQLSDDENNHDDCEDYDEDKVLMVHRPKQKFSPQVETESLEPVVYNKPPCDNSQQKIHACRGDEGNFEMIGETQALDVLERDTQEMENCFTQESNVRENIGDSNGLIEAIVETELESEGMAYNSTEDNKVGPYIGMTSANQIKPSERLKKDLQLEGQETSSSTHDCQKHVKLEKSVEADKKRHYLKETNGTRKCRKSNNSFTEGSESVLTSQPAKSGSTPNNSMYMAMTESGRTKRTRRGLASKIGDGEKVLNLSTGAQEAIRRSVLETKSRLEVENGVVGKSPSKPSSEIINLDTETDEENMNELIGSEGENVRACSKRKVKSPSCVSKGQGKRSKISPKTLSKKMEHHGDSRDNCKPYTSAVHSTKESNTEQANTTTDQVMSELKACFESNSENSSDDEDCSRPVGSTLSNSVMKGKGRSNCEPKSSERSYPSPVASPPGDGGGDACQPGSFEKSLISGVEESPAESDNDIEEEERVGATVRGRKRVRQQIASDSDELDEEHSPSKSSVSSVLSSQAEILSTQQANVLEGDVDKLRKEIAFYEAKLGAQPDVHCDDAIISHGDDDDDDDDDDEDDGDNGSVDEDEDNGTVKGTDSAALCKRLPDVFVVDESPDTATEKPAGYEDDKSEDDLFVSPLSPSPPSRKSKVILPPAKRIKMDEPATQFSENFLKQFQSPGGTVRSKKQLDFVQSSLNSFASRSGNATVTKSLERDAGGTQEPKRRSSSPVLSSQRSKLLQSKNAAEAGPATVEKLSRKICFVTSGLTREDNALALVLAKNFELVFSSKFTKDVTHVVMKAETDQSFVCDRTLKFFQGVANKCWVVAFSWVKKSLSMNRLLPEAGFEITGDTSAGEFAGGAHRSRESDQPLFENFCFACVGTSQEMPKESLFELVSECGASCVEDPVALMSQTAKHKIIVRCSDSDAEPSDVERDMFNGLYKHMGLVTVMREWILDSLGSYTLQPMASYVLNTLDNVAVPF
ncbi:breast cancer type 1 susceptibility protein homolog [Elysia marginata]|uniref:Breast cancer type 1 susceptibility protein homolog n=1 Tax=Elysia marginata TaxID=1093978 RepID=A0AAV4FFG2_9GAST|nr:breast cancer type 1 susceptibility protein homolog [Elysia marginata]